MSLYVEWFLYYFLFFCSFFFLIQHSTLWWRAHTHTHRHRSNCHPSFTQTHYVTIYYNRAVNVIITNQMKNIFGSNYIEKTIELTNKKKTYNKITEIVKCDRRCLNAQQRSQWTNKNTQFFWSVIVFWLFFLQKKAIIKSIFPLE